MKSADISPSSRRRSGNIYEPPLALQTSNAPEIEQKTGFARITPKSNLSLLADQNMQAPPPSGDNRFVAKMPKPNDGKIYEREAQTFVNYDIAPLEKTPSGAGSGGNKRTESSFGKSTTPKAKSRINLVDIDQKYVARVS